VEGRIWRPYARPLAGFKGARDVQRHPSDAKCVTKILRGGAKVRKLGDKV